MSMKPGCVVYNPAENNWCVLVEHHRDDGEVRRFMSFHKNRLEAQTIKKAHEEANANERNVTVSMFEYDYIPNDEMLAARMMMNAFEQMFVDADKEHCND
nr:MAG TPA: Protein of unknown function (DUF3172) [Caudoviricetes sp.]